MLLTKTSSSDSKRGYSLFLKKFNMLETTAQAGVISFQMHLQDVTWHQQMEIAIGEKEQCKKEETKRDIAL